MNDDYLPVRESPRDESVGTILLQVVAVFMGVVGGCLILLGVVTMARSLQDNLECLRQCVSFADVPPKLVPGFVLLTAARMMARDGK